MGVRPVIKKKRNPLSDEITGIRPNGVRGYQPKPETKVANNSDLPKNFINQWLEQGIIGPYSNYEIRPINYTFG